MGKQNNISLFINTLKTKGDFKLSLLMFVTIAVYAVLAIASNVIEAKIPELTYYAQMMTAIYNVWMLVMLFWAIKVIAKYGWAKTSSIPKIVLLCTVVFNGIYTAKLFYNLFT
ncbi:hypothetical protein O0Q50_19905 [Priestia aryabhattai]|uniref:DUF5658 domain-containing protein n=1 Tax=Priestia aryabhattai TaxID=412384 RepID=A0AAX6NC54_PRIAR|nr:hypothetical protein [Priestia aryabhattai]MDU9693442.1 hypothetical protein [Priestia aryabhattai]